MCFASHPAKIRREQPTYPQLLRDSLRSLFVVLVADMLSGYALGMKMTNLTNLRRNLSDMLNAVNADREPLVVTRRRGKPVVLMSLEDYRSMERLQRPAVVSDSASGLWKALSEVDEMAFVPRAEVVVNPLQRPPSMQEPETCAETAVLAPSFKRHPSR